MSVVLVNMKKNMATERKLCRVIQKNSIKKINKFKNMGMSSSNKLYLNVQEG